MGFIENTGLDENVGSRQRTGFATGAINFPGFFLFFRDYAEEGATGLSTPRTTVLCGGRLVDLQQRKCRTGVCRGRKRGDRAPNLVQAAAPTHNLRAGGRARLCWECAE